MTRLRALACAAVLAAFLATPAQATPVLEQTLIATGGDVVVTFESNGAGYTSVLYLDGPLGDEIGAVFNNWTTQLGTSMNLGSFADGTELVFKLLVQTGDVFYTGDGSRNPDGLVHAVVQNMAGRVVVGFEDVFGGGDFDYNDLVFAFTNVTADEAPGGNIGGGTTGAVAVDEPSTLLLLGSGLVMVAIAIRRQSVRR